MPDYNADVDAMVRQAFVAELCCPPELVRPDSELAAMAGLDSVKLLRVIAAVETAYDVGLDDDLLYDLKTVSNVTALVCAELSVLASLAAASGRR